MAKPLPGNDHDSLSGWSAEYLARRSEEMAGTSVRTFKTYMHFAWKVCESPIERMMLAGLLYCPFGYQDPPHQICYQNDLDRYFKADIDTFIIPPQATLPNLPYRFDFLVAISVATEWVNFVVECDGHDFHERTKQQAARDRKRDREIQTAGVPVLRFTGSEIFRDLDACVEQVDVFASEAIGRVLNLGARPA